MSRIAKTPCKLCIFASQGNLRCQQGLKQIVENGQRIAPGWCRGFVSDKNTYYSLPTSYAALIYLENSNIIGELDKTIKSLIQLEFPPINKLIVIDNTGPNRNRKLHEVIKIYKFDTFKLEQRFESDTSFEKAIDMTLRRYTKEDYLIVLKSGSKFKPRETLPFCTLEDRHVMWEFRNKEGIYLRKAFLQLGGGKQFVDKLLYFENCKDLIKSLGDILK